MASASDSQIYKIILAGKRGVGKSTIYEYLLKNIESGDYNNSLPRSTTGQWDKWLLNVPGRRLSRHRPLTIKVYLWDTACMEAQGVLNMTPSYFNDVHGVMLVYDPGNLHSLRSLKDWIGRIREANPRKTVLSLWRNYTGDESNPVEETVVDTFLKEFGIPSKLHFTVSTSSNENIKESFVRLAHVVHQVARSSDSRLNDEQPIRIESEPESFIEASKREKSDCACAL